MSRSEVESWYEACAEITRTRAKNFWWGIRLLRPDKRRALSAVYAVARRADDIADGNLPMDEKLAGLKLLRAELEHGHTADPVLRALFHTAAEYPIPLEAFGELVDGCEADVLGRRYSTWNELETYCCQVAGSIGRLSLGVFGTSDPVEGPRLANSLGIALQLTNILRDVREDRRNGRIYLPSAELAEHGVDLTLRNGELADPPERLIALYEAVSRRTRTWYDVGLRLLPTLAGRSAWCCGALSGIYRDLLRRIDADPLAATRGRVSVPAWRKLLIVSTARF